MNSVCTPSLPNHRRTNFAVNSGPLSERRCSGGPCRAKRSARISRTSCARVLRPTLIVRHCPRVLVEHRQKLQHTTVVRSRAHEVVGPDVILVQRPEPDARSIVEPHPAPLRLPSRHFEPLLPPDPLHTLVVHLPTLDAQQVRDLSVPVATEPARQPYHVGAQRRLVVAHLLDPALRRARLAQHTTRVTFTGPESLTYIHHTPPSALGAQKFPLAASSRISLSTVRFATARFRRAFSFSNSLKRRA